MALNATDLIRIADLIKLAAETARAFCDEVPINGKASKIVDAVNRINAAAEDLTTAGRELAAGNGQYQVQPNGG